MTFIAVRFGFSDRPVEQLGADAVIDNFGDFATALERLAERAELR